MEKAFLPVSLAFLFTTVGRTLQRKLWMIYSLVLRSSHHSVFDQTASDPTLGRPRNDGR